RRDAAFRGRHGVFLQPASQPVASLFPYTTLFRSSGGSTLCGEASGVFWMAQAGLLDGKEATTYWRFFEEFGQRFPGVQLNRDKHLTDAGRLYCATSSTSACDLYLHLIERFCGLEIAQTVARDVLHEVQRSYTPGRIGFGGQKLH